MSTDLHLHLPKLRMSSAVNLNDDVDVVSTPDHSSYSDDNSKMSTTAVSTPVVKVLLQRKEKENEEEEEEDVAVVISSEETDQSYKTPTSKESKIPEILTCPPAPKKPKPFVSCKRKLLDEFFEVSSNEDMDAFFRSTFPKRTCPCT